jgi:hypothetical protein
MTSAFAILPECIKFTNLTPKDTLVILSTGNFNGPLNLGHEFSGSKNLDRRRLQSCPSPLFKPTEQWLRSSQSFFTGFFSGGDQPDTTADYPSVVS